MSYVQGRRINFFDKSDLSHRAILSDKDKQNNNLDNSFYANFDRVKKYDLFINQRQYFFSCGENVFSINPGWVNVLKSKHYNYSQDDNIAIPSQKSFNPFFAVELNRSLERKGINQKNNSRLNLAKKQSSIVLQSAYRRKIKQEEYKLKKQSAILIQSLFRSKKLKSNYESKKKLVIILQSIQRRIAIESMLKNSSRDFSVAINKFDYYLKHSHSPYDFTRSISDIRSKKHDLFLNKKTELSIGKKVFNYSLSGVSSLIGAVFVWQYSAIVSVLLLIASWTFLSYLWGAKIWGPNKK